MNKGMALLFTRCGMGQGPLELQHNLAGKFLSLFEDSDEVPGRILFYTEGVKLACQGSPVLDQLRALEARGVELILCQTCLDYFGLRDRVAVGIVGGMPDILEAMQKADKVVTL
ncbi:MAG: DsrE family protein [Chloroflexi bacterium]|nr:DsrE family protein [Chloroflexota bacterium]